MREENNGGSSFFAFLLGAVIGTAAGLLIAPRAGRDTRRRLQRWAEELEGKGEDLLQEGRELLSEGKEVLQDKTDKVKGAFESGRKLWERATDR